MFKGFRYLFEPAKIGCMEVPNRIVMPAMGTNYANADGTVSKQLLDYYAERAKGGVGLIIVEISCVARGGKASPNQVCVWGDEFIPGLRTLVDVVHNFGSKIALQLHHAGRQTIFSTNDQQPVAPSPIATKILRELPREMTIGEVEALVEAYGEAARRAREAGFDAIELHGGHGYLICQFLSPYSNKRVDKYGGGLEGRLRFALEIIASVKANAGADFPIIFRISADELLPEGLKLDETRVIARRLEEAGIHALHVSGGCYDAFDGIVQPPSMPHGCFIPFAMEMKKQVNIPVITVGRITDPVMAEGIIEEAKADFVAMGRALLADPELPIKVKEGRLDDLRMCICCLRCIDTAFGPGPISCSVNAAMGNETAYNIAPASQVKKIVIIGGGPGGMEAARVAAMRGHRVVIFEETNKLGGQLLLASAPPHKADMNNLIKFLSNQVTKLGVEIRLGKRATKADILAEEPEVVVVASGSTEMIPQHMPGIEQKNVVTARQVIRESVEIGDRVVVVGGGLVGLETAELLVQKGKGTTVVEMLDHVGSDMGFISRRFLLQRLKGQGVRIETSTKAEVVTDRGLLVTSKEGRNLIEADTIITAVGARPNNEVADELRKKVPELYVIGDASEPRRIKDAIAEGFRIGREL